MNIIEEYGWHTRGYLPHFEKQNTLQFITFRLADSIPVKILSFLEEQLKQFSEEERKQRRYKEIEKYLDKGKGCCALRHPEVANMMQETLILLQKDKYKLIAWCIMPNHVHVLIEQYAKVSYIIKSWKSYSGRWMRKYNAKLGLGVPSEGYVWMREYWDRFIRDEKHFNAVIEYIHNNSVKAKLCNKPEDWKYSSARFFLL